MLGACRARGARADEDVYENRRHGSGFEGDRDPFIVYTSNIFAILGLRALYFLLAGVMDKFHYLKWASPSSFASPGSRC